MYGTTYKHPWVALLGWFPPVYLLGIVRHWGKPWCQWDGGFLPISSGIPTLWWPTRLYNYQRYQRG